MKKLLALCLGTMSFSFCGVNELQQKLRQEAFSDSIEEVRPFHPEWRMETLEYWSQGSPKEVVFVVQEQAWPVKRISFYEEGSMASEADLEPFSGDEKSRGRLHGMYISYDENGEIKEECLFRYGKKEGLERRFAGVLVYEASYVDGALHGIKKEFSQETGSLLSEEVFQEGLRSGPARYFYETGEKYCEATYKDGLLQGKRYCWWKNGTVKEVSTWRRGFLHDQSVGHPAYARYNEEGKVIEEKSFLGGVLHGPSTGWYGNGNVRKKGAYVLGKREGVHEEFDKDGTKISYKQFHDGELVGDGWDIRGDKKTTFTVTSLSTVIVEEFFKGKETARYSLFCGKLQGKYEEKYPSGALFKVFSFDKGNFSGEEIEYFPSGVVRIRANYKDGLRDGSQEEWFETGKIHQKGDFSHGEKNGFVESYYSNGKEEFRAQYREGVLDGLEESFYENGVKKSTSTWANGVQIGNSYEWSEDGVLTLQEERENEEPNGTWITFFPKGGKMEERHYVKGVLNGEEMAWNEEGKLIRQMVWKDGELHGDAKEWYDDGSIAFEATFLQGKPQGKLLRFFPKKEGRSQVSLEEEYTGGGLNGEQKVFYQDGVLKMVSQYKDGLLHGTKKVLDPSSKVLFLANYDRGKLFGKVVHTSLNGTKEIQNFKDNHPDGLWQIWYPPSESGTSVKELEATFCNGVLEGEFSEFDEKGTKILSRFYQKGKREGISTMYSHNGTVLMTAEYVGGKQHGLMRSYFESGALQKESFFENGLLEGEEKTWLEGGQLGEKSFYRKGKLHGLVCAWNDKGTLIFEAEYDNGLRNGKFNKYNDDGSPKVLQTFSHDVLVKRKNFSPSASKK